MATPLIHDGRRLGTLLHDPALGTDGDLLAAVSGTAALTLSPASRSRSPALLAGLTARELEVSELVAEGLSNAGIAKRLFVSEGTVEKHLTAAFEKLGLAGGDANRRVALALAVLEARQG